MVFQIIDLDLKNPEMYAQYTTRVSEIIHRFGGRYLVRGGQVHAAHGWQPGRVVVITFENLEDLQACYASPEYQEIVHLRLESASSKSIVVEGLES